MHYYHCVDTSSGGLLDPEGIIHVVVSAAALMLFIYLLLKCTFPKLTQVNLPQVKVTLTYIGYLVWAYLFTWF